MNFDDKNLDSLEYMLGIPLDVYNSMMHNKISQRHVNTDLTIAVDNVAKVFPKLDKISGIDSASVASSVSTPSGRPVTLIPIRLLKSFSFAVLC